MCGRVLRLENYRGDPQGRERHRPPLPHRRDSQATGPIAGIGAITASAQQALVPDPGGFKSGRHFAAWALPCVHTPAAGKSGWGASSARATPRSVHSSCSALYRPRLVRHRVEAYAARAAV